MTNPTTVGDYYRSSDLKLEAKLKAAENQRDSWIVVSNEYKREANQALEQNAKLLSRCEKVDSNPLLKDYPKLNIEGALELLREAGREQERLRGVLDKYISEMDIQIEIMDGQTDYEKISGNIVIEANYKGIARGLRYSKYKLEDSLANVSEEKEYKL